MAAARHRIPRREIAPQTGRTDFAGVHIKTDPPALGKAIVSRAVPVPDGEPNCPSLHLCPHLLELLWLSARLLYQLLRAESVQRAYLKQHAPHPSLHHRLASHAAYRLCVQDTASAALRQPYAGRHQRVVDAALDALRLLCSPQRCVSSAASCHWPH